MKLHYPCAVRNIFTINVETHVNRFSQSIASRVGLLAGKLSRPMLTLAALRLA